MKFSKSFSAALFAVPFIGLFQPLAIATPFIMSLSSPGVFVNRATGVSADGSVVTGTAAIEFVPGGNSEQQAFRWTIAGGAVGIGNLAGRTINGGNGQAVSADGTVIVGGSQSPNGSEAFRWNEDSGIFGLGILSPSPSSSIAYATSGDGSVVVGATNSPNDYEAFRWTAGEGMQGLGDLPGGHFFSQAKGVSADGQVIVGEATSSDGSEAFMWTPSAGMVGLGDLEGGQFHSHAYAISLDGKVVVGVGRNQAGDEAFRWTKESGMVPLGDLPGNGHTSIALAVSGDGSVIGGGSSTDLSPTGTGAFIWTQTDGMRLLQDVLTVDYGIDMSGWFLEEVHGISSDGKILVGTGINETGKDGWIVSLRTDSVSVSAPSTIAIFGLSFACLLIVRHRLQANASVAESIPAIAQPPCDRSGPPGQRPDLRTRRWLLWAIGNVLDDVRRHGAANKFSALPVSRSAAHSRDPATQTGRAPENRL